MVRDAYRSASALPIARAARESELPCKSASPILAISRWVFKATVYKSRRSKRLSSDTVTPIPRTRPPWFVAPKCGLPRREPSIEPSERPMESASAVSKSSGRSPLPLMPRAARAAFEWSSQIERLKQWPASIARPTVPADSSARSRSNARKGICRGFLRHRHS